MPQLPSLALPRVQDRLYAALQHKLTLIHAPLGFGKTQALRRATEGLPLAWYVAAPWHLGAFIEPLVGSVRARRSEFGRATVALAQNDPTSTRFAESFLLDLQHREEELYIVIDDAHELDTDPLFGDFLRILLEHSPSNIHFAVSSRTRPPWLTPDIMAKHAYLILQADDLRLQPEEVLAAYGDGLTYEERTQIFRIVEQTRGWPAAVSLQLRQTRGSWQDGDAAALGDHVLAQLPVKTQAEIAALALSLEQVLSPEHLETLLPFGLVTADGPLGPQLEPLVRDASLRQLARTPEVHMRVAEDASRKAEAANNLRAALHYALSAKVPVVSELLARHPEEYAALGKDGIVHLALQRVAAQLDQDPRLAYMMIVFEQQQGEKGLQRRVEKALAQAMTLGDIETAFLLRCKHVELRMGQLDDTIFPELDAMSCHIPASLGDRAYARFATLRGWSYALQHRFQAAIEIAVSVPRVANFHDVTIMSAYALLASGDLVGMQRCLDELLRAHEQSGALLAQVRALIWSARLSLLAGETVDALDAAKEARRIGEPLAMEAVFASLYAAMADAATQVGDAVTALDAASKMHRYAEGAWYLGDAQRAPHLAIVYTARALFLQGDVAQAYALARGCCRPNIPAAVRVLAAAEALAYARILGVTPAVELESHVWHLRDIRDAQDALHCFVADEILAFFGVERTSTLEDGRYGAFGAYIAARRSIIGLGVLGAQWRAASADAKAISRVAKGILHYCSGGMRFEALLVAAYLQADLARTPRLSVHFAPTVLAIQARGGFEIPVFAVGPPVVSREFRLTEREAEILQFLSLGFSNKELAERFHLSSRTIETHVERVLAKLEVTTRSRAIAKAIRLPLVEVE